MPALKSPQQEKFAQVIALEEKNQTDAYKIAYPTSLTWADNSVWNKACLLASNAKVVQRIEELKAALTDKAIKKALYTVEESFKELERLKELAIANTGTTGKADMSAAIKAEELRGKLARLYEESITIKKEYSDEIEYL